MTTIIKNEPTATERVAAPIPFYDLDGQLLTGQTFLTASSEIETYTVSGGWVAANADAVELGTSGVYKYQYSQAETNDNSIIGVRLKKAGYATQYFWNTVASTSLAGLVWNAARASYTASGSFGEGVSVGSITTAAANIIRDAILNYAHDTGLTVKGTFRRVDAFIAGRATGLRSSIARFFMRDGSTEAVNATQDVSTGTRSTADVTGSEA